MFSYFFSLKFTVLSEKSKLSYLYKDKQQFFTQLTPKINLRHGTQKAYNQIIELPNQVLTVEQWTKTREPLWVC